MANYTVTAESLSVLFHESAVMEVTPEPFRMQPNVTFIVPFNEYIRYIKHHTPKVQVALHMSLDSIRNSIDESNSEAIKCFLYDIAFAVGKEVLISQTFNMGATVILPSGGDEEVMDISYFAGLADSAFADKYAEYTTWFQYSGFKFPKKWVSHNETLFKMGASLYAYATMPAAVGIPELVYDL